MTKELKTIIETMPKVELHVHMEGAVQPTTLLTLAERHGILLPADTEEGIRKWYDFKDFDRFVEVYLKISECIRTPEDIETITREFLKEQKRQNVLYTEVTYTPYTHFQQKGLPFAEQLAALERGRRWGMEELGVECRFVFDIGRMIPPEEGLFTARWVLESSPESVAALGLGGPEEGFPPELFKESFDLIQGSPFGSVPHAGETVGPESVWGAIKALKAVRLGHGVRSWEDPALIEVIRKRGLVLEVCPSSNLCLKVYPDLEHHVLPRLVEAGLKVTINSDDPPMFNTCLNREYEVIADAYGYGPEDFRRFNLTAVEGALIGEEKKARLRKSINDFFDHLS